MQGVAWRKLGEGLIYGVYSGMLYAGDYPKLDEIETQHKSDDSRLRAVIECWLQGDGVHKEPSWRRIIWTLDDTNVTLGTIRHLAEPLPGKSCLHHILEQCTSPVSHQIVFIQTQGVCDHKYMYVSLPLHLLWFQLPLFQS